MERISSKEYQKKFKIAFSGQGKFKINYQIRTLNKILKDKYSIERMDSYKDFISYFFLKHRFNQKFDESKCNIDTFITRHVWYYLSHKVRGLDSEKKRMDLLAEAVKDEIMVMIKNRNDLETDLMTKAKDGSKRIYPKKEIIYFDINTTEKQIKTALAWLLSKKTKDLGEEFMKEELWNIIQKFFPVYGYDNIYLDVMMGYISNTDAAEKLKIHRNSVAINLLKIGAKMEKYLKKHGYDYQDVVELLIDD